VRELVWIAAWAWVGTACTNQDVDMARRSPVIHATVSEHINAPVERVFALYANPDNWPSIFPTIRSVRIVREAGEEQVVEVDHVSEGKVINVVRKISATQIELQEFKSRYDATFVNVFEPEPGGTRYTVSAEVRLKGLYRLAAPFVKPLVRKQMRRYVLAPMKTAVEKNNAEWHD
jgi:uncharacterized membrane protein